MQEGKLIQKSVYNNLMKYFEYEDWQTKKEILSTLDHQIVLPGNVLFLKGDREPHNAYIVASGKIALFKGLGTKLSSKKKRDNMLYDPLFACGVFFQGFCERLDSMITRDSDDSVSFLTSSSTR